MGKITATAWFHAKATVTMALCFVPIKYLTEGPQTWSVV